MAKANSLQKHYQGLPRIKKYGVSALLSTLAKKKKKKNLQKLLESCFQNVYICLKQQGTGENRSPSNRQKIKVSMPPCFLGGIGMVVQGRVLPWFQRERKEDNFAYEDPWKASTPGKLQED